VTYLNLKHHRLRFTAKYFVGVLAQTPVPPLLILCSLFFATIHTVIFVFSLEQVPMVTLQWLRLMIVLLLCLFFMVAEATTGSAFEPASAYSSEASLLQHLKSVRHSQKSSAASKRRKRAHKKFGVLEQGIVSDLLDDVIEQVAKHETVHPGLLATSGRKHLEEAILSGARKYHMLVLNFSTVN
jgi:hypothetical protein